MARSITATVQGNTVLFTDANDANWQRAATKGNGYAYEENGRVFVNSGTNDIFDVGAGEFASPSGTAVAIVSSLNSTSFLTDGGGSLPSNVVVVESTDDLPAIVSETRTLDSTKIYQWVGDINPGANIDINNSRISGNDPTVDNITFTNGYGFVGSQGGTIYNVRMSSSGAAAGAAAGKLFNLSGSVGKVFSVVRCVFSTVQNLGDLQDLFAVLIHWPTFSDVSSGITYTDVTNLGRLMGIWLSGTNNGGTYETIVGDFTQIQISNTSINQEAGDTGLDVSGITSIAVAAQLKNCIFGSAGTPVNGTFGPEWQVESAGIPVETDEVAGCEIVWSAPSATTTATQNVWVKCAGTTQLEEAFRFDDNGGTNNVARFTGIKTVKRKYVASLSVTSSVNNKTYEWTFADVSAGVTATDELRATRRKISTGSDVGALPVSGEFTQATNSEVSLYVRCTDATTGNMTIELGNYTAF